MFNHTDTNNGIDHLLTGKSLYPRKKDLFKVMKSKYPDGAHDKEKHIPASVDNLYSWIEVSNRSGEISGDFSLNGEDITFQGPANSFTIALSDLNMTLPQINEVSDPSNSTFIKICARNTPSGNEIHIKIHDGNTFELTASPNK